MLRYLRQHGNYLTPGKGITLTSVIVVLLRGIILNLLVWVPIFAALIWLLIAASLYWLPVASASGRVTRGPDLPASEADDERTRPIAGSCSLPSGCMLAGRSRSVRPAACGAFVVYSLITYSRSRVRWSLAPGLGTKYMWRRLFERWMRVPFWAIGVLLLVASVPFVVGRLHGWVLGSSFSLIGLASGLLAFVRTMQRPKSRAEQAGQLGNPQQLDRLDRRRLPALRRPTAVLRLRLVGGGRPAGLGDLARHGSSLGAFVLAIVTGWLVDLNLITIHRFYRDRLMEAFLPDVDKALRNETAPARQADPAALSSMCDPARPVGPTTSSTPTWC